MADRPSAAGGISRNVDTIIRDAVATVWTSAPVPPPGGRVTGRTPAGFEPGIVVPFFMGLVGSSSGFVSIAGDKRCWRIEEAGREGVLPCSAGGAASRIRTEDLSFTKALLYHCAKAAGNGAGGYGTAARPLSYVGRVSNIADDFGQTCCLVWRVHEHDPRVEWLAQRRTADDCRSSRLLLASAPSRQAESRSLDRDEARELPGRAPVKAARHGWDTQRACEHLGPLQEVLAHPDLDTAHGRVP